MDRISSLPDSLIHQIFSFMDVKWAVQSSVLSTRWKNLWKTLPFLNFASTSFDSNADFIVAIDNVLTLRDDSTTIQRFQLSYDLYHRLITGQLLNSWIVHAVEHNVQELNLHCYTQQITLPHCIFTCNSLKILKLDFHPFALRFELPDTISFPNLQELNLSCNTGQQVFTLPHCFFNCSSLQILELSILGDTLGYQLPDSISLPSLKELHLENICFHDEKRTYNLFSSCPILESLTIEECNLSLFKNLVIFVPKLKHLLVRHSPDGNYELPPCMIKICAINLTSFQFQDSFVSSYVIERISSLYSADLDIYIEEYYQDIQGIYEDSLKSNKEVYDQRAMSSLETIRNVKSLTLSASLLEYLSEPPALFERLSLEYDNLRYLKLKTWLSRKSIPTIMHLLSNSPNLETLVVEINEGPLSRHPMYPYWDEDRYKAECVGENCEVKLLSRCILHHLKFVEMRGLLGCSNELEFLAVLLDSAVVLEKTVVAFASKAPDGETRVMEFRKKLMKYPQAWACKNMLFS